MKFNTFIFLSSNKGIGMGQRKIYFGVAKSDKLIKRCKND